MVEYQADLADIRLVLLPKTRKLRIKLLHQLPQLHTANTTPTLALALPAKHTVLPMKFLQAPLQAHILRTAKLAHTKGIVPSVERDELGCVELELSACEDAEIGEIAVCGAVGAGAAEDWVGVGLGGGGGGEFAG